MKAVILSAGFGTRMKPLTEHTPKCLLPILGRPLIENIIQYLKQFGVKEIAVNTHHLGEKIFDHFKLGATRPKSERQIPSTISFSWYGVNIHLVYEPKILGTGGAIRNLKTFLEDEEFFIVQNGDTLTNLDLKPALDLHQKKGANLTLILRDFPPLNKILLSRDGRIQGIAEGNVGAIPAKGKARQRRHELPLLAFSGISIMSPQILKDLPHGEPYDLKEVFSKLIRRRELYGVLSSDGYWHEIGTISDYLQVHQDILMKRISPLQSIELPRKSIYVGKGSRVSKKAKLKGFVSIGKDCRVQAGAQLKDSIILCSVTVKGREKGERSVFGKGWQVALLLGGSDRRFYRVRKKGKPVVVMESKSEDPDFHRTVEIGKYLGKKRLGVPKIYGVDLEKGIVVMEDLGDLTLQKALKGKDEDKIFDLYCDVIIFLVELQRRGIRGIPKTIPKFGYKDFRWETNYFKQEFLKRFCKLRIKNEERLDSEFHTLAMKLVKEPLYFMHRDFQSQNIYLKDGKIRITDFQSARKGPLAYDLASLLKDCYFVLKKNLRLHLLLFYMDMIQIDGEIELDEEHFEEVFLYAGLQRNMQALGAFSYLSLVKGKHEFEKYIPAGIRYLRQALGQTDEFPELNKIVKKLSYHVRSRKY